MREIINIHIGQAGIQVGNQCWELYCLEHGIGPDGRLKEAAASSDNKTHIGNAESFFTHNDVNRYVPRSLFIDLEPSVIDQIKTGPYKDLFHPDQMIAGKEDAANNFARGHYTVGKELLSSCIERARLMSEACDGLQGFMLSSSVGGGTGSGLGALLLESLSAEFGKKSKLAFSVFPSPTISTSVVEPYNTVLAVHSLLEHTDVAVMLDNEAIYSICRDSLGVARPTYGNLNRLISQVISSLTTSLRFAGALNVDINEFQTNLVPYPRIHFMLASYAPLVSAARAKHERFAVTELTAAAFEPRATLCRVDPRKGKYMAACLMYRGQVAPREANSAVEKLKTRGNVRFVDWSPTGFKFGISDEAPCCVDGGDLAPTKRAVSLVSNSTVAGELFHGFDAKFDLMYKRRAFVHWFLGEGMEQSELDEARSDLEDLEKDYKDIEADAED